jgi:ComEC/Rec2-related protein
MFGYFFSCFVLGVFFWTAGEEWLLPLCVIGTVCGIYSLFLRRSFGLCVLLWWVSYLMAGLAVALYWWRVPVWPEYSTFTHEVVVDGWYSSDRVVVSVPNSKGKLLLRFPDQMVATLPPMGKWTLLVVQWKGQPIPFLSPYTWWNLLWIIESMAWNSDQYWWRWWYMRGWYQTVWVRSFQVLAFTNTEWWLYRFRSYLLRTIAQTFDDVSTHGLLWWMFVGDRLWLSKEMYNVFVRSGLVHILVVSGWNIVMVSSWLQVLLFWLPLWVRWVCIGIGIVLYWILCGGDSTVVRAVIMWLLSLIVMVAGRILSPWRSIGYCIILMLCFNPYFLWYDLGFFLSLWAVVWIALMNIFLKVYSSRQWVWFVVPLFGATYGVLPWVVFMSSGWNILSLLANSIVVPFLPVYLGVGMVSMIFAMLFGEWWWVGVMLTDTMSRSLVHLAIIFDWFGWLLEVDQRWWQGVFMVVWYGMWWIYYRVLVRAK